MERENSSTGSWARDILPSVPFLTSSPSISRIPRSTLSRYFCSSRISPIHTLRRAPGGNNMPTTSPDVYRSQVSSFNFLQSRIDSHCFRRREHGNRSSIVGYKSELVFRCNTQAMFILGIYTRSMLSLLKFHAFST